MNIAGLTDQLLAWFRNQGSELLQPGKPQQDLAQFKSGEQYVGKVLEALPNARSLVQVGQAKFDMALPKEVRPGDSVRLVYVTSGPRPTFQLAQSPVQALQSVRLSDTAQQVNALVRFSQAANLQAASRAPATTAGQAAPGSGNATSRVAAQPSVQTVAAQSTTAAQVVPKPIVSNVAVFFSNAAATPTTSAMTGGSANPAMAMAGQAIDGARPALTSHPSLMAQGIITEKAIANTGLPLRLRQALSESGMFYESHLGRWTQGRMPLESIMREPQARLAEMPGRVLNLPGLDGVPEEAARLAGRQLQMLDGGVFFWQGYAWPDQWMEWQVRDDAAGEGDGEADSKWRTELRLSLPRLGEVSAQLGVGPQGLRIELTTEQASVLEEMKGALPDLVARLKAAELNLTRLEVGLADGERGSAP